MIGEVIDRIRNNKFSIIYTYDQLLYGGTHVFRVSKYYGDEVIQNQWTVSDLDVVSGPKDILLYEADGRMQEVDDAITQRRLIESTLDT